MANKYSLAMLAAIQATVASLYIRIQFYEKAAK
jgi:hypothetical protein